MKSFIHAVNNPEGIHARPAGILVKEAQKYDCEVTLVKAGKQADLKRLFAVMGLGVKQGAEVEVRVAGSDEEQAAAELAAFMKEHF